MTIPYIDNIYDPVTHNVHCGSICTRSNSIIYFNQKRKQSLSNYFIYRHNIIKFSELKSSKRKPILKKLCHFIRAINTGVCPPGS